MEKKIIVYFVDHSSTRGNSLMWVMSLEYKLCNFCFVLFLTSQTYILSHFNPDVNKLRLSCVVNIRNIAYIYSV